MTTKQESNIEYLHVVDSLIDQVGEKIESVYPILAEVDPKSDEFQLLDRLWVHWCHYLSS